MRSGMSFMFNFGRDTQRLTACAPGPFRKAKADEQLALMAIFTAITGGSEVVIVTRDTDVLEQYYKALNLMKEHYRAMWFAEHYAAHFEYFPLQEVPIIDDGVQTPVFSGSSFLQFETTDIEFRPLPPSFTFVNIYCLVLGNASSDMKVTYSCFCAEKEMEKMLKVKAATSGLNTDKLNGRNCTIRTAPLTDTNHRVVVCIGTESTIQFGGGTFFIEDFGNTVFDNERHAALRYPDEAAEPTP